MRTIARTSLEPLRDFLRNERASSVVLVIATVIALVWANAAWASYESVWTTSLRLQIGPWPFGSDARHWISDAAMALFFFVVGLEIKRELVDGELRTLRRAALPVLAAAGGMLVPAVLYLSLNRDGDAARGWGIPMATDIAFAVGVLSLLGSRVPTGLRVFLLSVAIVDDIGAIAVIALFYTDSINGVSLITSGLALVAFRSSWHLPEAPLRSAVLVACGVAAWMLVYQSGVHATIAGVALACLVPGGPQAPAPVARLEHALHPWTGLVIVPLFALANAGLQLSAGSLAQAAGSPISIGIFLGLVVGKALGLAGAALLAIRLRIADQPAGVSDQHIVGVSLLGGIGFTVSLFIAQLAFDDAAAVASAKAGVFAGSLIAGIAGFTVLRWVAGRNSTRE